MYYFYSVVHIRTGITKLGISNKDPRSETFKSEGDEHWNTFLRYMKVTKRNQHRFLKYTLMHESPDLNVIKQWKNYYYKFYDARNNPKFIHSKARKIRPNVRGKKCPFYGKNYAKEYNLRWYTDGINTNVRVTEGTQPAGFKLGRICHKKPIHSPEARAAIAKAHMRPIVSPNGIHYPSIKDAARITGYPEITLKRWLKRGDKGWKYLKKKTKKGVQKTIEKNTEDTEKGTEK